MSAQPVAREERRGRRATESREAPRAVPERLAEVARRVREHVRADAAAVLREGEVVAGGE